MPRKILEKTKNTNVNLETHRNERINEITTIAGKDYGVYVTAEQLGELYKIIPIDFGRGETVAVMEKKLAALNLILHELSVKKIKHPTNEQCKKEINIAVELAEEFPAYDTPQTSAALSFVSGRDLAKVKQIGIDQYY